MGVNLEGRCRSGEKDPCGTIADVAEGARVLQ